MSTSIKFIDTVSITESILLSGYFLQNRYFSLLEFSWILNIMCFLDSGGSIVLWLLTFSWLSKILLSFSLFKISRVSCAAIVLCVTPYTLII